MMRRVPLTAFLSLALAAALAAPRALPAQTVEGRVVDAEARVPLSGVQLRLLEDDDSTAATAFSDESGHFLLTAPRAGHWRLAADLLGHGSVLFDSLELIGADTVRVEIRMAVEPVVIDEPVVVIARQRLSPDLEDFHRRRQWGERSGVGWFLHGDDIRRGSAGRPTDLLRTAPGVRVSSGGPGHSQIVRMRGRCVPAIYIDGNQINRIMRSESLDTYLDIQSIAGIEVYRGMQQPGGHFYDSAGCGLVLVWTKHGAHNPGEPPGWTRMAIGVGLLLALIGLAVF